jgi:hypothetical protein
VVWWRLEGDEWRVENTGIEGLPLGGALVDETIK